MVIYTTPHAYSFECILQIVIAIYLSALASQSSRFVEFEFVSVNVTSLVDPTAYVTGCRYTLTPFIARYEQVRTLTDTSFPSGV